MTSYLYVVLWFAVGLILLFRFGKENKVFYLLGGFFMLLGCWWLADAVTDSSLFEGVWGWVLRGVTAVALIIACKVYYDETKRSREADEAEKRKQAEARRAALSSSSGEPLSEEAGDGSDSPSDAPGSPDDGPDGSDGGPGDASDGD